MKELLSKIDFEVERYNAPFKIKFFGYNCLGKNCNLSENCLILFLVSIFKNKSDVYLFQLRIQLNQIKF